MNKDKILNQISELDIFKSFLNISEITNKNISSPFTEDKQPSFRVYKDTLTYKCHSTGKQGDCFQLVADLNKLDCKNNFNDVLELVAKQMGITRESKKLKYHEIKFEKRHEEFWDQGFWNVKRQILNKYDVNAISEFCFTQQSTQKKKTINIANDKIGFAYKVDGNVEIYIPKYKNGKKFFQNRQKAKSIFGLQQLNDKLDFLVISAGKKDCLILNSNGIPSVCFRSENHHITNDQVNKLKQKTSTIFICYDNDDAGQQAMLKVINLYDFIPLTIPKNYNDIADYLLKESPKKFIRVIEESLSKLKLNAEKIKNNIFDQAEQYLEKRYSFRYNEVMLTFEYRKKGQHNWVETNENNLYIELNKNGIKLNQSKLIAILKSDFVKKYNPLLDYFQNLTPWNKTTDHLDNLASYVNTLENEQFKYHFKKWCVRAVKCVFEDGYFNKQAFILVHKGQSSGKSTWCRFLCPPVLKNYIAEDIKGNDKDDRILICKNFLINLDELAVLSKRDINALKAFFSKTFINERLPYDKKNTLLSRVCSFIGSTNMGEFLSDETGSVRWLCFELSGKINFDYSANIDINEVWAQAYHLYKNNFDCELSVDDIKENELRNEKYSSRSAEYEIISQYVTKPNQELGEIGLFQNSTDIQTHLRQRFDNLHKQRIGSAMVAHGFDRVKRQGLYGYLVNYQPLWANQ